MCLYRLWSCSLYSMPCRWSIRFSSGVSIGLPAPCLCRIWCGYLTQRTWMLDSGSWICKLIHLRLWNIWNIRSHDWIRKYLLHLFTRYFTPILIVHLKLKAQPRKFDWGYLFIYSHGMVIPSNYKYTFLGLNYFDHLFLTWSLKNNKLITKWKYPRYRFIYNNINMIKSAPLAWYPFRQYFFKIPRPLTNYIYQGVKTKLYFFL